LNVEVVAEKAQTFYTSIIPNFMPQMTTNQNTQPCI